MKRRTLGVLIEQAQRMRDDAAQRVAGAHRAVDAAQRTLDTLSNYRDEQAQGAHGRSAFAPPLLRVRERFARKLDGAIVEQTQVRNALQDAIAHRRDELVERQQRLLAFRTLQTRRDALEARRQQRLAQRETDEIAARSFARRATEPK